MNLHYNQKYTKEEIECVLQMIKDCVRESRFVVSKNDNRQENIEFINNYNINNKKQKEIILKTQAEDFCYTVQNTKAGFENEILYIFCPQILLYNFDQDEEVVDIYMKFNLLDMEKGKRLVVISFHKPNKTIEYLFREK